jgi:hypothetical protein
MTNQATNSVMVLHRDNAGNLTFVDNFPTAVKVPAPDLIR